ncbi:MAG: site-2 protease family protein, partial [Candidatus Aureabacteria bacterium]|nr:site-2 protease family protein [Candidatus Auribacterota bacterium]
MFEKRVTLFRLLGFEVRVDPSWLVLALLISWTLAESVFPARYKNLSPPTYWLMGVTGAVGLFASIVFHELCHSLVARAYGVSMKGITLFIFGGVAEMDEEPAHPKAEFFMAVIGPISSLALCAACYGVYRASALFGWPAPAQGVARYLALMNGMLAVFNLLPGFPLDGGRVLRSILWAFKGNLRWATRVASQMGAGLGTALLVLGILNIVVGREFIGGIWWLLIGMFLRNASRASYQQLVARKAFEGEPLRRFMQPDPVTVPPSITIQELVEEYIYRYHYKM